MLSFGKKVIRFHQQLQYTGNPLPTRIKVMNPFRESPQVMTILRTFADIYLNDTNTRHLILGINPGRFGGGLTGIPFTDPKRLVGILGIPYEGKIAHEPSAVFVYEVIEAYGGPVAFYRDFYINSPCPLGFVQEKENGKEVNYNYYDSPALLSAVQPFLVSSLQKLGRLGVHKKKVIVLGTGRNMRQLESVNMAHGFFGSLVPLEHPRFVMQYKSREKNGYIRKYLDALNSLRDA